MGVATPVGGTPNNKPMIAMVVGIVGIVCCQLLGPVAWYLGKQELAAIKTGASAASGEGMAKAGMILGIVGTVLLGLSILWVVFFGGLAMLGGLSNS